MKHHMILLLLLSAFSIRVAAQDLFGRVTDERQQPLEGVSVVLTDAGNHTLLYTTTDAKGGFTFHLNGKSYAYLSTILLGYSKQHIAAKDFRNGQTVCMKQTSFALREIKVKAERIVKQGDTLVYSVSGFKQQQDRSIADVIKKMPGMEVRKDGTIAYQGKNINKFYVEGMDLMGSSYGQASNNLSADKVKQVQVLENHEAVKMMRGMTFSDQAAVNLVLTDEARGTWCGTADLGLGAADKGFGRLRYDNRLTAMYFNKHRQTLSLYKNNNVGVDVNREVLDLTNLLGSRYERSSLLSPLSVAMADVNDERYRFNRSHLLATNWLWRVKPEADLRLQLTGYWDDEHQQSATTTEYFSLAGQPIIRERRTVDNTSRILKGELLYKVNADSLYVTNRLKGYVDWNRSRGLVMRDDTDYNLWVNPQHMYLTNDFQLMKKSRKGHTWQWASLTTYNHQPDALLTLKQQAQQLDAQFFNTSNTVSFRQPMGQFIIDQKVGLDYDKQHLDVDEESRTYSMTRAYACPSVSLFKEYHKLELNAKLSLTHQKCGDKTKNELWVEPNIRWQWEMSATSKMTLDYSMNRNASSLLQQMDLPLFLRYSTQITECGEMITAHQHQFNGRYNYSQPINGIFFSLTGYYTINTDNRLYRTDLEDGIYRCIASDRTYTSRNALLSGRLGQSFAWAKTVVTLSAKVGRNDYRVLTDNQVQRARMQNFSLGVKFSLRPLSMLTMEGESTMEGYRQQNRDEASLSAGYSQQFVHELSLNLLPLKGWQLTTNAELYHSNDRMQGTHFFQNALLSYRWNNQELQLSVNNIWGISTYERRYINTRLQTVTACNLRPREVLVKYSFTL